MPNALSRSFTLEEMVFSQTAVRKGIRNKPSPRHVEALRALCGVILQPLRDSLDAPLSVTSGYRSPDLNRAIGGAKHSQHMDGQAADLMCFSLSTADVFKRVLQLGLPFDQLIYEGGRKSMWVHVSFNADGTNRGEILAASFPPGGGVKYRNLTQAQAMAL